MSQKLDCGCKFDLDGTSINDVKLKSLCEKHRLDILKSMDKISIITNECYIMNQNWFPKDGVFSEVGEWAKAKWQEGWDHANDKTHKTKFVKVTFEMIDDPHIAQTKKENDD